MRRRREPMPRGWTVEWAGFMRGVAGLAIYGPRRVLLNYGDLKSGKLRRATPDAKCDTLLGVLIHEFTHVRCPHLRHGREFERIVVSACAEVGL